MPDDPRACDRSRGHEPDDATFCRAGDAAGASAVTDTVTTDDDGFTLIEILLTLVIISTVILALFTATIAIYAYSAAQRDLAILNGALTERIEEMSGVPVSGGNEANPGSTPNQYANTEQLCTPDVETRSRQTVANPIGSTEQVTITMIPTHFLSLSISPSGETSYRRESIDDIDSAADPDSSLAALCRQAVIYTFDVTAQYLDRESALTIYRSWKP